MLLRSCRRYFCVGPRDLLKEILQSSAKTMSSAHLQESSTTADAVAPPVVKSVGKCKPPPPQLRRDKQHITVDGKKKQQTAYIPGTVQVQVLGAGTNGAPSAVYLFTDQSRYLFNCGEGTQRLAHEHKTKLARLEQIFVTRNTWTMMGGLPGLALTVQDVGVRELALYGPPHLDSILMSMKRFVVLKTLQVKTKDCTQIHDFEDAVMRVKCVPLFSHNIVGSEQVVIAYICKLKPRPGALNLEKCVEHGVPPGPLLGLLKNGVDVTLDNGTVVKSKDVSEAGETAQSFVFLDIPSEDYLPALQDNAAIFHNLKEDYQVALLVHFSPPYIVSNNRYQAFVEKFPPSTQHVYLGATQNPFSGYVAAHRIQYQLNQLHPRMFPLLCESAVSCGTTNISHKLKKTKLIEDDAPVQTAVEDRSSLAINSLTNFHLRPPKGLDQSVEAKLNPSEYISETQVLVDFPALLEKLKKTQQQLAVSPEKAQYPKIIFLGTGSCIPNKTRNVSAILVQPHENSYMLLDCGEGTLGQIIRFFGPVKAKDVIKKLKAIYVSHLHADHHIGLIGLLKERQSLLVANEPPLLLFAPKQIWPWLNFYDQRIESIAGSYELIGNAEMLQKPIDLTAAPRNIEGVQTVATCLVRHCQHSFGVCLTLAATNGSEPPVKITYSGDSMPCIDLIELGRDSTILIHEATMEDDLVDEAKLKMHSTISQAIQQGRDMRAQHIILTHFSQRYAKLPRIQNLASAEAEAAAMHNVAIAFDNMQVTLDDLEQFHLLYPTLKALFAEHTEELEQRALKREMKLERKRKLLNAD